MLAFIKCARSPAVPGRRGGLVQCILCLVSKREGKTRLAQGRFLSANWDTKELLAKSAEVTDSRRMTC